MNIIYARVSTNQQDYSRQIGQLKNVCLKNGWDNPTIIGEKASGYNGHSRKGFSRLRKLIESGKVENVLCWEVSRLGRRILDVLEFIEDCTSRQVNIHIHNIGLNTMTSERKKNPVSDLILSVMANLAQMESERLSERIRSGLDYRKKNGGHIGGKAGRKMKTEDIWKRYSGKKGLREDLKTLSIRKCAAIHNISPVTAHKLKTMITE